MGGSLLAFGHGYVAQALARRLGCSVIATARDARRRADLEQTGVSPIDPADSVALADAAFRAKAILISAPPDDGGCPGLRALAPALQAARPRWIGYLSSTSVYGDLAGRWAFEASPLIGKSLQAVRRAAAERDWLALGRARDLPVHVFRLAAIYGPGRSALDRLPPTIPHKPDQVFSRAHVDDIAALLAASLERPNPGRVYNVADDAPSSAESVLDAAAALLGRAPPERVPFADADLSPEARRFWQECRRVSNARAKAELAWRPAYPSYRSGLQAVFNAGSGARG